LDGMLEVKRMDEIKEDITTNVSMVFVDSFYDDLKALTHSKEKLIRIFKNSFVKEKFYIALMDGNVAGILACSDNGGRAFIIRKEDVIQNLGIIKGNIVYPFLEKEFHIPLSYNDETAYIEAVATHLSAREKGVATRLLEYITKKLPYTEFRLTVKDNNKAALEMYKKLGFLKFDKLKASFFEKKYFKYKFYMKLKLDI